MNITETALPGVLLIEPEVYGDARGFFMETWNAARYCEAGIAGPFVQDNVSLSKKGVLRGLHYQNPAPQGKLMHVLQGEVFDVAVDLRRGAPTFGQWAGVRLSAENKRQLYVPEGFAHGFVVTSPEALFCYKCTAFYAAAAERALRWDDPDLGIDWPVGDPVLSEKDAQASRLRDVPPAQLFTQAALSPEKVQETGKGLS